MNSTDRRLSPLSRVLIKKLRLVSQERLGMEAWLERQARWEQEFAEAREIAREDEERDRAAGGSAGRAAE